MSNCEKYLSIFEQLIKNKTNDIVYDRKDNVITINNTIKLKENVDPQFGNCDFSMCLQSYIKTNKYTGSFDEKHFNDNQICSSTTSYENGHNTCYVGYNNYSKHITFF